MLTGRCQRGITCRFGSKHITENGYNKINHDIYDEYVKTGKSSFKNHLSYDLLVKLRKRTYDFSLAEKIVNENDKRRKSERELKEKEAKNNENIIENDIKVEETNHCGVVTDEDVIKTRQCEKKKINWKDKLYLSPLTTVGNLPFR